jgi:hypothetical protein
MAAVVCGGIALILIGVVLAVFGWFMFSDPNSTTMVRVLGAAISLTISGLCVFGGLAAIVDGAD